MGRLNFIFLLLFAGGIFSCNVISSDSQTDKLEEQIIFSSNRSASNNPGQLGNFEQLAIHRMNPDGSGVQRISAPRTSNESHFEPSISHNGESMVFSVRIAHQDSTDEWYIYKSVYNGTEMQYVAGTRQDHIINPRWSPVDSRIVFGSNRFGNYDLFTIKSNGTELTQITDSQSSDAYPTWSPDGTQIAFTSNRDGSSDIYIKDLETDQLHQITNHDSTDNFPRWSPDGTQIAFTSTRDGDSEVYFTDVEGTNITQLTHNETSDTLFSWSPNGEKIVITTHRDGNLEVFKIDVEGQENPVNLSNNPAADWDPDWGHIKVSEE